MPLAIDIATEGLTADRFIGQDAIATEGQVERAAVAWNTCIEALISILQDRSAVQCEISPNTKSIMAAVNWCLTARRNFPFDPPTLIMPFSEGGIIIERRYTEEDSERLVEIIITNGGMIETTTYHDSRIVDMVANALRDN